MTLGFSFPFPYPLDLSSKASRLSSFSLKPPSRVHLIFEGTLLSAFHPRPSHLADSVVGRLDDAFLWSQQQTKVMLPSLLGPSFHHIVFIPLVEGDFYLSCHRLPSVSRPRPRSRSRSRPFYTSFFSSYSSSFILPRSHFFSFEDGCRLTGRLVSQNK